MSPLTFWIPTLPPRDLTSNGNHRSGWAVAAAKDEMGEAAYFAALQTLGPAIPQYQRADIYLDFHICYKRRPKDGRYRFTDPSNGGGNVAKPIVDYGIVKVGLIPDDRHENVRFFTTHITPVDTLDEEGIHVSVTEVQETDAEAISFADST